MVAANSFQNDPDSFFGIRNFKYWGPVVTGTVELTINVADAMNMGDFFARTIANISGGSSPPIVINECPDTVASSACALVKTINDSEESVTNCEEEVFSETSISCLDGD